MFPQFVNKWNNVLNNKKWSGRCKNSWKHEKRQPIFLMISMNDKESNMIMNTIIFTWQASNHLIMKIIIINQASNMSLIHTSLLHKVNRNKTKTTALLQCSLQDITFIQCNYNKYSLNCFLNLFGVWRFLL